MKGMKVDKDLIKAVIDDLETKAEEIGESDDLNPYERGVYNTSVYAVRLLQNAID